MRSDSFASSGEALRRINTYRAANGCKTPIKPPAIARLTMALMFNVDDRYQLRLIANNLLDKSAPILPNSYDVSLARSNTIPQRYDALGRNIVVGATVKF